MEMKLEEMKLDKETIKALYGLLYDREICTYDMDLDKAVNTLIQDDINLYKKLKTEGSKENLSDMAPA